MSSAIFFFHFRAFKVKIKKNPQQRQNWVSSRASSLPNASQPDPSPFVHSPLIVIVNQVGSSSTTQLASHTTYLSLPKKNPLASQSVLTNYVHPRCCCCCCCPRQQTHERRACSSSLVSWASYSMSGEESAATTTGAAAEAAATTTLRRRSSSSYFFSLAFPTTFFPFLHSALFSRGS